MISDLFKENSTLRFVIIFLSLFLLFYYFNVFFFGITSPGNYYSAFLANHLNYIVWLRWALLHTSSRLLNWFGYTSLVSAYELLTVGHGKIILVYTCLGLGIMSFFAAFVIAYPKPLKRKLLFLFSGLFGIQVLNVIRLILLSLYWHTSKINLIDHHILFNILVYVVIAISLYFWIKSGHAKPYAAN